MVEVIDMYINGSQHLISLCVHVTGLLYIVDKHGGDGHGDGHGDEYPPGIEVEFESKKWFEC